MNYRNGDIMLVDKPAGITSFDVIRILRKKTGIRKIGHSGTLDPLATGLLIIALGSATKKLSSLIKLDKEYLASIKLGIRTDTGDITGAVVEEKAVPEGSDLAEKIKGMIGNLDLPVPAYSAIKKKGVPLYTHARKGDDIDLPVKTMRVLDAEFLGSDNGSVRVRFKVGSGTYIRSLAEELGKRLRTVATIEALRRTVIGSYKVEGAETVPEELIAPFRDK